jgi:hypothetical protein
MGTGAGRVLTALFAREGAQRSGHRVPVSGRRGRSRLLGPSDVRAKQCEHLLSQKFHASYSDSSRLVSTQYKYTSRDLI